MAEIKLSDAKKRLSELIDKAAFGEDVVIIRGDGMAFKIIPISLSKPYPKYGSARGLIKMSDEFDDNLDDFKDYMP